MDFLIDDYRGGKEDRVQSNPRKTCVNVNECIIPLKKQTFGTWRNAGDGNRNWILLRSKKMNWMKKERLFFYEKLMIWLDMKKGKGNYGWNDGKERKKPRKFLGYERDGKWMKNSWILQSQNTKAHPPVLIIIFVFLEFERLCSHFHVCFLLFSFFFFFFLFSW